MAMLMELVLGLAQTPPYLRYNSAAMSRLPDASRSFSGRNVERSSSPRAPFGTTPGHTGAKSMTTSCAWLYTGMMVLPSPAVHHG